MYAEWWLLPIGLLVMFWGVYDRCPIWQAITARFKKSLYLLTKKGNNK